MKNPNFELSKNLAFAFFKLAEALRFYFLPHVTPSSAAVFKLWICGILLRSKTTKPRLKNCPMQRLVRLCFNNAIFKATHAFSYTYFLKFQNIYKFLNFLDI
jgi:hypothetical protein